MTTTQATEYLGSDTVSVSLTGGSATRIYYQGADGSIHEAAGMGAAASNRVYNERVVVTADKVRINSPIAAVSLRVGNNVDQIRLYFVNKANLLHELCGTSDTSGTWSEGFLTRRRYEIVANSSVLYACFTAGRNIRVGYQSALRT